MTVLNEYGRALFLLAEEESKTEEILADIRCASEVLDNSPEYVKILNTPAISKSEKLRMAGEAFSVLSENVKNLLMILCEKRLIHTVGEVYSTYLSLYNEKMGIIDVEAVTTIPLTEAQKERIGEKLFAITGKKAVIKNTVDPSILGGMKLRYLGIQLDGSVKTRLDGFAENLKNIVI